MLKTTPGTLLGALAISVLLASGCATTSRVLGGDGATCEADSECTEGLRCKASTCTPERSRVGQVCVTDKGCAAGLQCAQGRCSEGVASPGEVERACAHLANLVIAASTAINVGSGEASSAAQNALERQAFVVECHERLSANATSKEKAACIANVANLEAVQRCP